MTLWFHTPATLGRLLKGATTMSSRAVGAATGISFCLFSMANSPPAASFAEFTLERSEGLSMTGTLFVSLLVVQVGCHPVGRGA